MEEANEESMKHKFKSLNGALRRIRELRRHINERDELLDSWSRERKLLAKLAADTPQFYNPLQVAEAKRIRDEILKTT